MDEKSFCVLFRILVNLFPVSEYPVGVMLTNDDGPPNSVFSPFIRIFSQQFASSIESQTKAWVCLPAEQQSWVGKAVTRFAKVTRAISNWKPNDSDDSTISRWTLVTGTPAVAVNVGLRSLSPFPVDLVISGPNLGRNIGSAFVFSSGTVGAALEAAMLGKKAIALSFAFEDWGGKKDEAEIIKACSIAVDLIWRIWFNWPDDVKLFNVNIPLHFDSIPSIHQTHLLLSTYGDLFSPIPLEPSASAPLKHADKEFLKEFTEEQHFKFDCSFDLTQYHSLPDFHGSDVWAVEQNFVSVTPLSCNLQQVPLTNWIFASP